MRVLSRRSFATSLALLGAALVVPAAAGRAFAADPAPTAQLEIMVLQASNGPPPGSIDPRIDQGKSAPNLPSAKLKAPPLSAYNTYAFKDRKPVTLTKGVTQNVSLINGRTLAVTLTNVVVDKTQKRCTVVASISQPNGDAFMKLIEFTASPQQSVFVGGIASPTSGSLVLAFTVES